MDPRFNFPSKNPNPRGEEGGREEEEEDAREGRPLVCSCARGKEKSGREKGRGVRGYLTPTTLNPKD